MKYRLVYMSTREVTGKNIPVNEFIEIPLKYVYDNWNDADCARCQLCSEFNYGYVKIVEE